MIPAVSVIMPVYNCVSYIKESVDSILSQTFRDFEFLIIDDHSTDGTFEYLQTLQDTRIKLTRKPHNTGYVRSLNMALDMAQGEYIARMDGDDISLPERFSKQVGFMNSHPDVLVVGTCYKFLGTDQVVKMPQTYEEAKVISIMHVPVAHPTAFIRRSVLNSNQLRYNEKMEPAEDYDLWTRILDIGKIENLPETLLLYRRHSEQESIKKLTRLVEAAVEIRSTRLEKLLSFRNKQYDNLFAIKILTRQDVTITGWVAKQTMLLLTDMYENNLIKRIYHHSLLYTYLRDIWLFHILKFKKPLLKDAPLLLKTSRSVVTRMEPAFYLRSLKRMFFS